MKNPSITKTTLAEFEVSVEKSGGIQKIMRQVRANAKIGGLLDLELEESLLKMDEIVDCMNIVYHENKSPEESNQNLGASLCVDIEDGKTQRALSRVSYFGSDLLRFESLETLLRCYHQEDAALVKGKEADFIRVAEELIDGIHFDQGFTPEQVAKIKQIATGELKPIAEKLSEKVRVPTAEELEQLAEGAQWLVDKGIIKPERLAKVAQETDAKPGSGFRNIVEVLLKNKSRSPLDHAERKTDVEGEGRQ